MSDEQSKPKTNNQFWKYILDGSILSKAEVIKQLPFALFLTIMAVIYIGNRYHAEQIIRESSQIEKELKELRAESITIASELMFISKESEVLKLVEKNQLGLEESTIPPKKIFVEPLKIEKK